MKPVPLQAVSDKWHRLQSVFLLVRSLYSRPAALSWAFFSRRGRRDLFLGGSFPFLGDFVDGVAFAGAASPPGVADFSSATTFCFAK
jgi:hypothetical protein